MTEQPKKNTGMPSTCVTMKNVRKMCIRDSMSIPTHSFLFHPGANCDISEFQRTINVQPWEYEIIQTPNRCLLYTSETVPGKDFPNKPIKGTVTTTKVDATCRLYTSRCV